MSKLQISRQPIERDDLVGAFVHPTTPGPHPTVILCGGWGGGIREVGAEAFALEGFAALALAYFGVEPLPHRLTEIPLEYFAEAIAWLKTQPAVDADRIAVVGNSKGGELALLLGVTYPEDVKAVVGYAPSAVVWQGQPPDQQSYRWNPKSSWSLGGEPLPFVRFAKPLPSEMPQMTNFFFGGSMATGPIFHERALKDEAAVAAASIAVEKINGPVLVISGTDDRMWPSTRLCEMVMERLEAHEHPFPYEHLRYEGAGHMIVVPGAEPDAHQMDRLEVGGSKEANKFANEDSWQKVLGFLRDSLNVKDGKNSEK
ncbi:MAG TPA: alpha/beta fold hydrolase [Rubrobacteraceae bacterium]|nr:alpha/beta fold hydrolase [Rubrobacteraceae bacterium]